MNASIRIASISDSDILLKWRNETLVRQFSKFSGLIHEDEHIAWLKTRLTKCDKEPFFVFMIGELAAGTARLDNVIANEKILEVSILLDPKFQGFGNARVLLDMVCNYAIEKLGAQKILAEIHSENFRSIKLFQSTGFNYLSKDGVFLKYQKLLIT